MEHSWKAQQLRNVPWADVGKALPGPGWGKRKKSSYSHWNSSIPFSFLFDSNLKNLKSVLLPIIICQAPFKCLTCLWPLHKPIGQMIVYLIWQVLRWDVVKLNDFPRDKEQERFKPKSFGQGLHSEVINRYGLLLLGRFN